MSQESKHIVKNFFRLGFPNLLCLISLCYFIFSDFSFENLPKNDLPLSIEGWEAISEIELYHPNSIGGAIFVILFYIALSPIWVPLGAVAATFLSTFTFFEVPIFFIRTNSFVFSFFMFWLVSVAYILSFISAFKFKFGEMSAGSSSATHYEIEYHSSNTVKVEKIKTSEGDIDWIVNILLFFLRIIIIALLGIILFSIQTFLFVRNSKK